MSEAGQSSEERRKRQEYEREQHRRKHESDRALRAETYAALNAARFDEAEAVLLRRLDATGCDLFDCVRRIRITTPPASVARWLGDMVAVAQRAPRDGPLTAVEISFTNAGVSARNTSRPANPEIEVYGYTDQSFAFSTAGDAELAALCQGYPVPWQGCFDWCPESARYLLEGVEAINRHLLTYKHAAHRPEFVWVEDRLEAVPEAEAAVAANLLFAVAVHRFMHGAIAQAIVSVPLVVIVDGNDETYIRTVHHRPPVGTPERATPTLGASRVARLLGRRG
jgi:hypothetical protein